MTPVIDIPSDSQAVIRRESQDVGRALSVNEIKQQLQFMVTVMRECMEEGTDFGKIPGCGDKPGLFQPGAQKLMLTFQLTDELLKEVRTDMNGGHREYETTVRLHSATGRHWDGVGSCSTMETKYRYRQAQRKCPKCGQHAIIAGKAEYGGGWLCYGRKGGCGAKFEYDDPTIAEQQAGQVENENPADYWNTVRKMAFKRALVAASINATGTSQLWTQDIEDMGGRAEESATSKTAPKAGAKASKTAQEAPKGPARSTGAPQGQNATGSPKSGASPAHAAIEATVETRKWMIDQLQAGKDQPQRSLVEEFFRESACILPTEALEDLPLRFVPVSRAELNLLAAAIVDFQREGTAGLPYRHGLPTEKPLFKPIPDKPVEVPREEPPKPDNKAARVIDKSDPEWWRKVIIPVPHKGEKRSDYMKHPETIGQLYDQRHESTADAQESRQRLWGFLNHYEAKGWKKNDGTPMPPSETDLLFREALDALSDYIEANPNERSLDDPPADRPGATDPEEDTPPF